MNAMASKYRIMVVDDDPDIRLTIAETLKAKYEVVLAKSGEDALDKIEDYEPDFIILDLKMPGIDGIETCQAIRHNDRFQNVQVMFLSAYGSRDKITKAYEVGGNLFVPKPIQPERVLKNVDVFFEKTKQPIRPKKYTIAHIHMTEGRDRAPDANGPQAPPRRSVSNKQERILKSGAPQNTEEVKPKEDTFRHAPIAPRPNKQKDASGIPPRRTGMTASSDGPQVAPPSAGNEAVPNIGSPQGVKPRVLVVEDDPDLSQLAEIGLSEDFEVVCAKDGIQGLEYVIKYQPDLICLDVMMPKMNGYQLCQQIRSQPSFSKTPIIIMTAKNASKDEEYAERVGANAFLTKPFDMENLINICKSFTDRPDFVVRKKARALQKQGPKDTGPRAFSREGKFE